MGMRGTQMRLAVLFPPPPYFSQANVTEHTAALCVTLAARRDLLLASANVMLCLMFLLEPETSSPVTE
jgi:hypothetical protein